MATAGPLSTRIAVLCDEVGPRIDPALATRVREVRRRLHQPLRVAVAGRLKAGKSTLVNALIGRRVAPTAVGECTRVVTQLRYGTVDRVDVVRRDGTRHSLPLDTSGMIPQRLGVPRPEVAFVDVTLASDRLRDLIVVDTPGLSSADPAVGDHVKEYLFDPEEPAAPLDPDLDEDSAAALARADAIVYVFTQSVRADDLAALEAFRAVSTRLASSPINSLGLFNKVDKLDPDGADPWPVARPLAAEQARILRRVVSDVVPVVGLLAETTEVGRLTAADCADLRAVAALPAADRLVLLASVDLFRSRECPVPAARRERLLGLLDLYGINVAVSTLVQRSELPAAELVALLSSISGLAPVRHTLDRALRRRADTIKAAGAVSALHRIAGLAERHYDRTLLRDTVEQVARQPEYHRLRTLEAAHQVITGAVELPEPMERELARLALGTDPAWILDLPEATGAQLATAAAGVAARWRAYAVAGAAPAQYRVAMVAHRGFHLLRQQLQRAP